MTIRVCPILFPCGQGKAGYGQKRGTAVGKIIQGIRGYGNTVAEITRGKLYQDQQQIPAESQPAGSASEGVTAGIFI